MIHSTYLSCVFDMDMWREKVEQSCEALFPYLDSFDTIVFRGNSGALIAPAIASKCNKKIAMVRKASEASHCGLPLEGNINLENYVIVDDFIASGQTIQIIVETVEKEDESARRIWKDKKKVAKCVGVLLYRSCVNCKYICEEKIGHEDFFFIQL